jgi:hypothetical protein
MDQVTPKATLADDLLDEVMPDELDWQRLVRSYPKSALTIAAVGGFVLGRRRGVQILEALSGFAADMLTENVNQLLGRDVL